MAGMHQGCPNKRPLSVGIRPVGEIAHGDWLSFVEESDECWLYHHPKVHPRGAPGFGVLVGERLVGLCLLGSARAAGSRVLTYGIGPAGLALLPEAARPEVYARVRAHLLTLAKKAGACAVFQVLPALAPAHRQRTFAESHLARLGFRPGIPWGDSQTEIASYTSIIDLTQDEAAILKGFTKSAKAKCKLAAKLPLSCTELIREDRDADWSDFITNHVATFTRTGARPFAPERIVWLRDMVAEGLARLLNFHHAGRCVASLVLMQYKRRAFYFASGVQDDYYAHGLAASLHWEAMRRLKAEGYLAYELGQSYPRLAPSKMYNIGQFKRSFGGELKETLAGTLVVAPFAYATGFKGPRILKKLLVKGVEKLRR